MSVGGGVSAASLAALGDNASSSMRWLEMALPGGPNDSEESNAAYTLRVIEEPANKFVRMITDPLNLISVMGPARSGKSTLMNLLAGCKVTELFPTYPGMETFTKGVYIPTRTLSLPDFSSLEGQSTVNASDSKVKVSFIDTEGQGALGDRYDMDLFSPALVTSRVIIYNRTGGLLTEEILSQLGMMTQAAQRLRSSPNSGGSSSSTPSGPLFGHLCIIFNQFRLNNTDTVTSLQNRLMTNERETDSSSKNRNNIRNLLRSVFESIQVYILPDRLKPDARDALSDGTKPFLLLDDFEPRYLEYFKTLRVGLSNSLKTPRELSTGTPLTGGSIADFMPLFAEAINRSEPLNLPSIFELSQNNAINKAQVAFLNRLSANVDSRLAEAPKPTQMLTSLFDNDVTLLLAQLAMSISYMPPAVVQTAQQGATNEAASVKSALLTTNLTRIKALMSSAMTTLIGSIGTEAQKVFPNDTILISPTQIDNEFVTLYTQLSGTLKTRGDAYDPHCLPDGYESTIQAALNVYKNSIVAKGTTSWAIWAADLTRSKIQALTDALTNLGKNTKVGDSRQYVSNATVILDNSKRDFNQKVDAEYLWSDKQAKKDSYGTSADSTNTTQKALWEQNKAEIQRNLALSLERLKSSYIMQLQDSLQPHIEPMPYTNIVNATLIRDRLSQFCTVNNLADDVSSETLFQFDSFVSNKKSEFTTTYNQACTEFSAYISGELSRQVPLTLQAYNDRLDCIDLNLNSAATTRANINAGCDTAAVEARNTFTNAKTNLHVQENGIISKSIIDTYQSQLDSGIRLGKVSKLSKYDEVVSVYNKALLTGIILPVIDQTLANKYSSDIALDIDVETARVSFMNRRRGDGTDATERWNEFKRTTYLALKETVRRNNAYRVPGLDGNLAATKEIQIKVIKNITMHCANVANVLGMSWITGYSFEGQEPQDKGMTVADPLKPGQQNSRVFRMNNTFNGTGDDYDWQHKTNLEFFDWTVEISDIIWGRPIITDLKPLKLDTIEYGSQATPMTVTIGTTSTEATTITDSQTWGVGAGVEVGYKWGQKDVWEANVKGTFNGKFDSTHSNQVTSTFTTNTSAQIVLPANRINCINQMVFNQRTSLPYTARVRVVPKLRFQNGFTKWGSGGDYRSNPNTNARKVGFGNGIRNYGDMNFSRCDEIREDARSNADPWEWTLCMQRHSWLQNTLDTLADPTQYEVFVKGKWEGITGKYAVTTVTPKNTNLTLMPNDI